MVWIHFRSDLLVPVILLDFLYSHGLPCAASCDAIEYAPQVLLFPLKNLLFFCLVRHNMKAAMAVVSFFSLFSILYTIILLVCLLW